MKPAILSLLVLLLSLNACKQVQLAQYSHISLSVAPAEDNVIITTVEKANSRAIAALPESKASLDTKVLTTVEDSTKPSPLRQTWMTETKPAPADDEKPVKSNDDVFWAAFTSLMFTLLTWGIILFAPVEIPITYVAIFLSGVLALAFGISALNRRKPGMKNYKVMAIIAGILGAITMFVGFYFLLALF